MRYKALAPSIRASGSPERQPAGPGRATSSRLVDGIATIPVVLLVPALLLPLLVSTAFSPKIHAVGQASGGISLTVEGSDFAGFRRIQLSWDGSFEAMPSPKVDRHGTFIASLVVPLSALPGEHEIDAWSLPKGGSPSKVLATTFVVVTSEASPTPTDALPTEAAAGTATPSPSTVPAPGSAPEPSATPSPSTVPGPDTAPEPSATPAPEPSASPTPPPTIAPIELPTLEPTSLPIPIPSVTPTPGTTAAPTASPSVAPEPTATVDPLPLPSARDELVVCDGETFDGAQQTYTSAPVRLNGSDPRFSDPSVRKIIRGCTFRNLTGVNAINIIAARNVLIEDSMFYNIHSGKAGIDAFGIYIQGTYPAEDIVVRRSSFEDIGADGIQLADAGPNARRVWIIANRFEAEAGQAWDGSENAVDVKGALGPVYVLGNLVSGFDECRSPSRGGTDECSGDPGTGIVIHRNGAGQQPNDVTVEGNALDANAYGVAISHADDVTIDGNTLRDSADIHLYIVELMGCHLGTNTFAGTGTEIVAQGADC